jgi:hypothetical protein
MKTSTTFPLPTLAQPLARAKARRGMPRIVLFLTSGSVLLFLGAWLGLKIQPAPFPTVTQQPPPVEMMPLPQDLPAPVARFYRQQYGESVPVIHTAILSGRGSMSLFGVTFPVRFRFTHEAGQNFRSYFELTVFGVPVMKATEYFVGGKLRAELPVGVQENDPTLDQSADVRMWVEYLTWLPAILLTDPQVRWEAVDDHMALLVIPVGEKEERVVVRFDPATGGVEYFEAMRYKNGEKMLWVNGIWFDDGKPWAAWNIEEVVYNADVDTSLAAKGP